MPRIVFNSWFAKLLGVCGIVLYPFILISTPPHLTPPSTLKHELSWFMLLKCKIFYFYFQYVALVVNHFWRHGNLQRSFIDNDFEDEAYRVEKEDIGVEELMFLQQNGWDFDL